MTDRAPSELRELREDLRFNRSYVSDELADEISRWILESWKRSDADTAQEYVEHQLNRLLQRNQMYNSADVADAEDAFPDACEGCQHYGAACPVLVDGIQTEWRDRALEDAETEKDARRVYEKQALDVGCIVIPRLLESWDDSISGFMERGERLLLRANQEARAPTAHNADDSGDGTAADVDVEAVGGVLEEHDIDLDLGLEDVDAGELPGAIGGGEP